METTQRGDYEADVFLVELLARTNALFLPLRDVWNRNRRAALYERRKAYYGVGLTMVEDAHLSAAERQARHRLIGELKKSRLIDTFRSRYARTSSIRLTDAGYRRASALAHMSDIGAGWHILNHLFELRDHPMRRTCGVICEGRGTWSISELQLAYPEGRPDDSMPNPDMRQVIENMALPALARGWIDSNATATGEVWYSPARKGFAMVEDGAAEFGGMPATRTNSFPEMKGFHDAAMAVELAILIEATPVVPGEIGGVALPVSCAGEYMPPGHCRAWARWNEGKQTEADQCTK